MPQITDSALEQSRASAESWAERTEDKIRDNLVAVGAVDTGAGQDSLRNNVKVLADRSIYIGFRLKRYLVMVEKGAGRGHGGKKGSTWTSPSGKKMRTNPNSLNKMNTGNRKKRPFFNPIIKREIDDLADAVADHFAVEAAGALIK